MGVDVDFKWVTGQVVDEMTPSTLATALHTYLNRVGYPIFASQVVEDVFPYVELWDDSSEVVRVLVCCTVGEQSEAWVFAEDWLRKHGIAGELPCGGIAHIVLTDGTHFETSGYFNGTEMIYDEQP